MRNITMNASNNSAGNPLLLPSVFENFLGDLSFRPRWTDSAHPLPVDIRESEKDYLFVADLPGVPRKSLSVNFEDGILSIEAKFANDESSEQDNAQLLRSERFAGSCKRRFKLPNDVAQEEIAAKLADGVLTVTVRKPDLEKKKIASRIKIN